MTDTDVAPPRAPIETRSVAVEAVSYPDRTIDLIVAPYDEWAVVEYRGRLLEESFAPGAFGAIRNRARKFLVNMDHDPDRWLGTVLSLDGENERGLRSTLKIRRTPEGDQALNDAADGMLGASIGMAVASDGQTIVENRRRITKAYLDHIALTATPAYLGSEVVEVRTAMPTVEEIVDPDARPLLEQARIIMGDRDIFRVQT